MYEPITDQRSASPREHFAQAHLRGDMNYIRICDHLPPAAACTCRHEPYICLSSPLLPPLARALAPTFAYQNTLPLIAVLYDSLRQNLQNLREALIGDHPVALLPTSVAYSACK